MGKEFACNRPGLLQYIKAGKKASFQFHGDFEKNKAWTKSNYPNQEISGIKKKNDNSPDQIEEEANDINK